jgi:TAG lipase/steryl ester hydrolase/phospholipase A2/LPA acyltransferase
VDQLRFLACNNFSTFPLMQKLVFFRETRHAFGRTALMLSGGATLTMYHLGVVKALLHADLLPRVISGSSGGSLVAAWLCTARDSELSSRLDTGGIRLGPFEEMSVGSVRRKVRERGAGVPAASLMAADLNTPCHAGLVSVSCRPRVLCLPPQVTRLFKRGVLFDIGVLERFVRANIPDLTFLEAYRLTHRVLNVTVTSASNQGGDVGRLLNYLTAPNVIVSSAVLASCAIPGVYEPVRYLHVRC